MTSISVNVSLLDIGSFAPFFFWLQTAAESRLVIKREVIHRLRRGTPLQKLLTKIGVHFTVVRERAILLVI
jgi:hypothetical protein